MSVTFYFCEVHNNLLTTYAYMYLLEEGAGREPVGGGRRRFILYMYICIFGGRGRTGAGRRGKTEIYSLCVCARARAKWRKGPGGSR